ncbi:Chitin synthase III catalytic subunit [Penicillium chermesinum]|uniref:Chitin synthase III catalytic subunit n=1 Tax=Penicillium chermesinum TaxID=63820 RepID=A0A9W9NBQ6_9EURO|nr:Chitin synthase III catalytic subunit [Penicillium chermesinum]KAJ5216916.1 Chitin synthase III catalytic subunit [Penicillium chermesinum]KAJ6171472.1 Chitin synthase III catalytic subunit [Penicillium chermesinum]
MGSTQFGNFHLFAVNQPPNSPWHRCALDGISLSGHRHLANLGMGSIFPRKNFVIPRGSKRLTCLIGSIILAFISILVSLALLWRTDKKQAAVGRREIQLFLVGYIIIEICEIFTVGGIPLEDSVRKGFSAVHIAAITATCWILLLNALVGYQLLDDGTAASIGLIGGSAVVLFIGTGYISLDTAFDWTGHFESSHFGNNRNIALYVLYQLFPLVCLFLFYVLEAILVLRVLGEIRPMIYLSGAGLLFAIGQIFQYVISVHICEGTNGKINGALFETFFTLLSVIGVWAFWSSITEDDWPLPPSGNYN